MNFQNVIYVTKKFAINALKNAKKIIKLYVKVVVVNALNVKVYIQKMKLLIVINAKINFVTNVEKSLLKIIVVNYVKVFFAKIAIVLLTI
jgi:hypothetical protein